MKEFLYAAKEKKRSFRVFVAEGAPRFVHLAISLCTNFSYFKSSHLIYYWCFNGLIRYQGHVLAKELVEKGIQTTVITDSAVFAMISRVNMVCI